MLKNWNHDLVHQLSEISDALWRMKEFQKNSRGCKRCTKMWKDLEDCFEEASQMLVDELTQHVKERRFN
jgi:hypothetical protein